MSDPAAPPAAAGLARHLVSPFDPPERQRDKLMVIAESLMRRVEQAIDDSGEAYAQFQRAALLEDQVRARTRDLDRALDLLNRTNADLAEAKAGAEAARANLAAAIEAVEEGFALFGADEHMVLCNARFCRHFPDLQAVLHPGLSYDDYILRVSQSRWLALPEGETPETWEARRRARHGEGQAIFNVGLVRDRWLQVSEQRTANGGTVILQTDVTEVIRAEREERERMLDGQARIIRATLDHITQGVCIFDARGRLAGWNDRFGELLAIPRRKLGLGLRFQALAGLMSGVSLSDGVTLARLGEWAATGTGRARLHFEASREGVILQADAEEMPDGGFVISVSDITPERRARSALAAANETLEARVSDRTLKLADALAEAERANASRARFVAAASHDLLQPLAAARLFIGAVAGGIGGKETDPEVVEVLGKATNALGQVEGILGALLDISRLEIGRIAASPGPLRLSQVLDPLREEFTALAEARGLRFTLRRVNATVISDPAWLRRILQNLIGNAVRYTKQGRVLVGARHLPGALRIEVHDTGPGIAEADRVAIFREFHRLESRASAAEGMGLGLAIVDRACAALDHPLGLSSTPGRGSCFSVTLPLAGPRDLAGMQKPVAAPRRVSRSPSRSAAGKPRSR